MKHRTQLSAAPTRWEGPLAAVVWLLAAAFQVSAATFNAKDYGAVGDDKTDNTAALTILRSPAIIPASW